MQQYLRKTRLSTWLDELGLRLLVMLLAVGWFVYLWGLKVPSLLAGAALGVMGQMALSRWRKKALQRKEAALRCRLGGELFLEKWLLAPVRQAHFQAALLLGEKYAMTMERITEDGVLCKSGEETLLVAALPMPEGSDIAAAALVPLQRACRREGASRAVACCTGKVSQAVENWARTCEVPVKIIRRDELVSLAGHMSPATDEQLAALAKRKKRPVPGGVWQSILRPDKARTFFLYGVSMLGVYVATGLRYYLLPGMICLALGTGARMGRKKRDEL